MNKAVFRVDTFFLLCLNKACSSPYGQALTYAYIIILYNYSLTITIDPKCKMILHCIDRTFSNPNTLGTMDLHLNYILPIDLWRYISCILL